MTAKALRRTASTLTIGVLLACASIQPALAQTKEFNVPAQSATTGIPEFARQAGIQILVSEPLVRGKRISAVAGSHSIDEALAILLNGTGLTASSKDGTTYTVAAAQALPKTLNSPAASGTSPQNVPVEDSSPAPPDNDKRSAYLEEVVVTAQKREERLIDTPQSVSVLSSDYLAKIGATQFSDFANTVPGLSFQTSGAGFTDITLRGVTTGFDVSPTVGIYVDEVPYGSSTAFAQGAQVALDFGLFDLDRVEVLRGPQGTLYGASTMGGLIKYVTREPDTTRLSGGVQAGVSDTNDGGINYNGSMAVNVPIVTDKAAVRASAYYVRGGGYIDNLARGDNDVNRSATYGARVDLLVQPLDALSIRITAFLQNISRDGEATGDYTLRGMPQYGTLAQYRKLAEPFHHQFRLVSGTVAYDFGPLKLTSISSYQSAKEDNIWDVSALYAPLLNSIFTRSYSAVGSTNGSTTDKFTQEVRLSGVDIRPLEWVFGAFYTHESSQDAEEFLLRDQGGAPAPNDLYTTSGPSSYQEYAAFGDLTWHLTDQFDVTGGLRYAHDHQAYTQFGAGFLISTYPTARSDEGVVTYLANTRYHVSDHATAYLRYATGYRPGGPNVRANDPVTGLPLGPASFGADKLKSYEAGFKSETSDRRFGFDVAGYDIDWSNIQVLANQNGFAFRTNVPGGAAVQGLELTLSGRPVSAFTATAAFAYQHAYLKEAAKALGAAEGERLPNVPRFTASLNADYAFAEEGVRPTLGTTLRYVSNRMANFNGSGEQYYLPSYTTFDLRSGLTLGSINMQLYVHNVFDKHAQLSDMYPQFGTRIALLQPRTVGLNLTVPF